MRHAVFILFGNIVPLLALAGALKLATDGRDGWGWFLFVAVISTTSIHYKDDSK